MASPSDKRDPLLGAQYPVALISQDTPADVPKALGRCRAISESLSVLQSSGISTAESGDDLKGFNPYGVCRRPSVFNAKQTHKVLCQRTSITNSNIQSKRTNTTKASYRDQSIRVKIYSSFQVHSHTEERQPPFNVQPSAEVSSTSRTDTTPTRRVRARNRDLADPRRHTAGRRGVGRAAAVWGRVCMGCTTCGGLGREGGWGGARGGCWRA